MIEDQCSTCNIITLPTQQLQLLCYCQKKRCPKIYKYSTVYAFVKSYTVYTVLVQLCKHAYCVS
jgi:hypothetical protein